MVRCRVLSRILTSHDGVIGKRGFKVEIVCLCLCVCVRERRRER
jgi:hypothetical protein